MTIKLGTGGDEITIKDLDDLNAIPLTIEGGMGADVFRIGNRWGKVVSLKQLVVPGGGAKNTVGFSLMNDEPITITNSVANVLFTDNIVTGTADGTNSSATVLEDTDADFVAAGVIVGDLIRHADDNIYVKVTNVVSKTKLKTETVSNWSGVAYSEKTYELTLPKPSANHFDEITGANFSLTPSLGNEFRDGIEEIVGFMDDIATIGNLAKELPIIAGSAETTVAKAMDFAEALGEVRFEIDQFLKDETAFTTDGLITELNNKLASKELEHLGASIISPLAADNIENTDNYDFDLVIDGDSIEVRVSAGPTVTNASELVDEINKDLEVAG